MGGREQPQRGVEVVLSWLIAGLVGATIGGGCPGVAIPIVLARCDPASMSEDNCRESYTCCSDDPAAITAPGSAPLFSEEHNGRSRSGMCILVEDLEDHVLDDPAGCPIPCNPTWDRDRLREVCGDDGSCCQTVELHEDDCVLDQDDGRWRPADGRDALASLSGGDRWNPTPHSTHQDPDLSTCEGIAGGDRGSEVFRDCVAQLTTANQRGYCMTLGHSRDCPAEADDYIDACEAMN